jgi:hypothetical protein
MHVTKMSVVALFPLMIFCVEKLFTEKKIRYVLYLGGVIAATVATAHLQFAYYALWGIGLYFLYKVVVLWLETRTVQSIFRVTVIFGFGVILGLVISARAYVPQYWHTATVSKRAITETSGKVEPGTAGTFEYAASWSLHPEETMSLILPQFSNFKNYWGRNAFKQNSEYFGFIPLFFFIAGIMLWRQEKRVRFFVLLFFFTVLVALGATTPFFRLCYYLIPGVKSLRGPSMISYLFAFSAIVVTVLTLEFIFSQKWNQYLKKLSVLSYIFVALGFLFLVLSSQILPLWKNIFSLDNVWGADAQQNQKALMDNISAVSKDGLMLLLMSGLLWFLLQRFGKGVTKAGVVLVIVSLIAIADTWRIDKQFIMETPYSDIPSSEQQKIQAYESLKTLDRTPYRVFPEHALYQGGGGVRFSYPEIAMITGFSDFTLKRYDKVMRYFYDYINQNRVVPQTVLNLLNAKYIVTPVQKSDSTVVLKMIAGGGYVYQDKHALPYFSFVHNYRVISNPDEVFAAVLSPAFAQSGEAIIEKAPPEFAAIRFDSVQTAPLAETVVLKDTADFYKGKKNIFTFAVTAEKPGLLILSDNYHPEWKATIDGKNTEIYQVNYVWKGVFVPSGKHEARFVFVSKEIRTARRISFAGLLILIVGLGLVYISDRRIKKMVQETK